MTKFLFVDCESVGLYGEAFAIGWVVINEAGDEIESGYFACPHTAAQGSDDDREWICKNVISNLPEHNCQTSKELRDKFWDFYLKKREEGVTVIADCPFPVETNFFAACVLDDPDNRKFKAPFPFLSSDTALLMVGLNPIGTFERLENELPAHHPLADARQSARIFIEALNSLTS